MNNINHTFENQKKQKIIENQLPIDLKEESASNDFSQTLTKCHDERSTERTDNNRHRQQFDCHIFRRRLSDAEIRQRRRIDDQQR